MLLGFEFQYCVLACTLTRQYVIVLEVFLLHIHYFYPLQLSTVMILVLPQMASVLSPVPPTTL